MTRKAPDYDLISDEQAARRCAELDQVIAAAHALELESPIIHYRIVGSRIELWTIHGGPFIYQPQPPVVVDKKKVVKKK